MRCLYIFFVISFNIFLIHCLPVAQEDEGRSLTISIPGLEGKIEVTGLDLDEDDDDSNRRVSISIPGLSGGGGLLGGLGSLFGVDTDYDDYDEDDDDSSVSLSFNFQRGINSFSDIFRQSNNFFQNNNPFGLNGFFLGDGPDTSFSSFNNFFSSSGPDYVVVRRPTLPDPSLGQFSVLQDGPWENFRNIFSLYNQPEHPGYAEVFGPVYGDGQGCGLCHLFPQFGSGSFIVLELVVQPIFTVPPLEVN